MGQYVIANKVHRGTALRKLLHTRSARRRENGIWSSQKSTYIKGNFFILYYKWAIHD